MEQTKYKVGQPHPTEPGLFFTHKNHGLDCWVTAEGLVEWRKERARIAKQWRDRNRNHVRAYATKRTLLGKKREYYWKNKDHINAKANVARRARWRQCSQQKYRHRARQLLNRALQGMVRDVLLVQEIGCTRAELESHLRRQLRDGMFWEDRKTWQIDHIIPLSGVDLTIESERKRVFHFSNLQVLTPIENALKQAKIQVDSKQHIVNGCVA